MKEIRLFVTLMQVAFIVMKLCNAIDWSWVIVLSPIYTIVSWYALKVCFTILLCLHQDKLKRKEWAKYGAKNDLDYTAKKLLQMQSEQMEEISKKKKELEERRNRQNLNSD